MTGPERDGQGGLKAIRLRYAGRCRGCGVELARGTQALHDPLARAVQCGRCLGPDTPYPEVRADDPPSEASSPGVAGASARREHERRSAAREERIRSRHPKLGGLILALSDDPRTTKAWETGAVGEERLGRRLDSLSGPLVKVLHDRRIPGSRANLDHLVVCPSGVLVIDAKRYAGRPQRTVEGGLFSPRTEKLLVGRRDCTRLVDGGLKQADLVREALADDTPVRSVLCFIEADWPLMGGDFTLRDVYVTWPRKLASSITASGPLGESRIIDTHKALADSFPPA